MGVIGRTVFLKLSFIEHQDLLLTLCKDPYYEYERADGLYRTSKISGADHV